MKYYEALNKPDNWDSVSIFLAGGITGCPDWQTELVEKLERFSKGGKYKSSVDFIVLNPRRKDFPIHDPNASFEQIAWEYEMLNKADIISYWFAKETIQPIVLFELGRFLHSAKPIIIGIHPEYARKQDVEIQSRLARRNQIICYDFDDFFGQIITAIRNFDNEL